MRPDHTAWRKSSYSTQEGGACIELARLVHQFQPGNFTWRKSSYSGQEGTTCVELADHKWDVVIRDSTNPEGPALRFSRPAVAGLVDRIKAGELDH
ncbi:DUF397 domain-containing protein [Actinomadura sp. 9N215]|uniref:DUF397 domain-containing protein n=1 Tax=Actinomadura sp. 9N215 TaxID=3375150 RepID=UPI0037911397